MGDDLMELAGVDAFDASPIENLARSLSSSVVRLPDDLIPPLPPPPAALPLPALCSTDTLPDAARCP